jgi:hypothetical protein
VRCVSELFSEVHKCVQGRLQEQELGVFLEFGCRKGLAHGCFRYRNHCFSIFEIRSATPSVVRISGFASSIANGWWQTRQSWLMVLPLALV